MPALVCIALLSCKSDVWYYVWPRPDSRMSLGWYYGPATVVALLPMAHRSSGMRWSCGHSESAVILMFACSFTLLPIPRVICTLMNFSP
jgi:hypothetical protein